MSTIREKAEQYMEKHFPESDFEDLYITTDQLVDGIPQAYEDGFKDAIKEAVKWLREHDMTKYIGVLYSGVCSITFDTEKLIKDITETIGD